MKPLFKYLVLILYWAFLTKSLLMTQPWELFSSKLADHPPFDLSFEPNSWMAHIGAYAVLGGLIQWASADHSRWRLVLFCLAFAHSGLCEYLQGMIPNRWPNLWDVFSNTLGLTSAFALHKTLMKRSKASLDSSSKTSPKKQAA